MRIGREAFYYWPDVRELATQRYEAGLVLRARWLTNIGGDLDGLEILEPARVTVAQCRGEDVEIRALTIGQLPAFARALQPVFEHEDLSEGLTLDSVSRLIAQYGDNLIEAVAIATGRPVEWMKQAEIDEFTSVALAACNANLDFFAHRLLPRVAGDVGSIARALRVVAYGHGSTPSSSSSPPATH